MTQIKHLVRFLEYTSMNWSDKFSVHHAPNRLDKVSNRFLQCCIHASHYEVVLNQIASKFGLVSRHRLKFLKWLMTLIL